MIELTYIENTYAVFANKKKGQDLVDLGDIDAAMRCHYPVHLRMGWAEFCDWMVTLAEQPADQEDKTSATPAVYPSVYQEDAETKEAAFVQYNSNWMSFDIDETASFDDMLAFLISLDCPYFLHTTTKHSNIKPRLRVLIQTDREVDPDDWPKTWANMDAMFRAQFPHLPSVTDSKTRNINRIFYVPRKWNGTPARYEYKKDGSLLDVGKIIDAFGLDPALQTKLVSYEPDRMSQIRHDLFIADGSDLIPTEIIDQAYAVGKTGRFFSLLVRAARRLIYKGYKVGAGELEQEALKVDALKTGKKRIRSLQEAEKAIQLAFSSWSEDHSVQATVTANKQSQLSIDYIDAECGAGKSYQTLQRVANEGGKYIYACDKVINIDQRRDELLKMLGGDAINWEVVDIYYNKKNIGGDVMDMSVVVQLNQTWQKLYDNQKNKKVIVFISHAALKLYQKWQDWSGYELIIDEVPEATYTYTKNFKDTFDVFSRYVCAGEKDGAAYELELTPAGIEAVASNSQDSLVLTFMAILQQIYFRNTKVWVKQSEWDTPSINNLNFFSVFTPHNLEGFDRVLLLGDKCAEMTIAHTWKTIWNVNFTQVTFKPTRKPRAMPVKDRCKIYYFDNARPSINKLGSSSQPANKIAEYIKLNEPETPLWTINNAAKPKSKKLDELLGSENAITPKAHGINDRQHYKAALWLAAMNPRDDQAQQYKEYAGMTKEDIIKDRELNAIYQFVMRTNLRDWGSTDFVKLYVYSLDQADYLKDRLGCEIEKIDKVVDETIKKVGRPKTSNKLTNAQRGKKRRFIAKYGNDEGLSHFDEWMENQKSAPNPSSSASSINPADKSALIDKARKINDD